MKVFTSKEFINKLNWLVSLPTNYSSQYWSVFKDGKWQFDCVRSIKAILWGFSADKNKVRGGTKYGSNGVADFTCNGGVEKYSTDVSRDFSKLVPGEYLCMKGTKYNHAGVYLGDGKVFECTTAWGTRKCMISDINSKGERSYKGVKSVPWTYYGKLIYIDYSDESKPDKKTIDELAQEVINGKWGNYPERKKRLEEAGYNYREVQDKVNELIKEKKYIEIDTKYGVWCRLNGYGFKYPKYKVIPYKTKCQLLQKNIGKSDGYNWDKVLYNDKEVYLPNEWNKYI